MKTLAKRIGLMISFILVFEMLASGLWPLRMGIPTAEASGLGPGGVPEKAYLVLDGYDNMSTSADDSIRVGQVITGPLSAMTAEAWVKVDPDKPSGTIIDNDEDAYFELSLRDDKIVFDTFGNNDQDEMIAQADFRDDEWHHIAVVFDGIYKMIYMDGVQIGKKQLFENKGLLGNGSNRNGFIGARYLEHQNNASGITPQATYSGYANYFSGSIRSVALWNMVRSPAHDMDYIPIGDTPSSYYAANLLGYWEMDEGEGNYVYDYSGHGHNGTLQGSPTWAERRGDTFVIFRISDDIAINKLRFDAKGALARMTAEAWVKVNPGEGGWSVLDFDRTQYFTFTVGVNGSIGETDKVNFHTADSTGSIHDMAGNAVVADGTWHHIAAVYDGTDKIIYVDGVEDARASNPHGGRALGTGATRSGTIGGLYRQSQFKGNIRDVRLWTTARSQSEISGGWQMVDPYSSGLLGYWKMNEGSGKYVYDYTPHHYYGDSDSLMFDTTTVSLSLVESDYGDTPGNFNVNQGAAVYQVPLDIPRGVGGLQPSLSLAYGSGGGYGMLGQGWSLAGLSVITRCPQTMAMDGTIDPVDYDANDQFCLDGMRMRETSAGEYALDRDAHANIKRMDAVDSNDYFEVKLANGLTYRYGASWSMFKSRTVLTENGLGMSSGPAYAWYLDRITDRYGNTVYFYYEQDENMVYPLGISYAGGTIAFEYEVAEPSYTRIAYKLGFPVTLARTLARIIVSVDKNNNGAVETGEEQRVYQLGYTRKLASNVSLLTTLETCTDIGLTHCEAPTEFTYGNNSYPEGWNHALGWEWPNSTYEVKVDSSGAYDERGYRMIDLNGDGYPDLVQGDRNGEAKKAYLNTGAGWGPETSAYRPPEYFTDAANNNNGDRGSRLIDVNNDGLPDFIHGRRNADDQLNTMARLNTGSGWESQDNTPYLLPIEMTDAEGTDLGVRIFDLDGDGLDDLVKSYNNEVDVTYDVYASKNDGEQLGWGDNGTLFYLPVPLTKTKAEKQAGGYYSECVSSNAYSSWLNWLRGFVYNSCSSVYEGQEDYNDVEITDLNGDGLPDILQANSEANTAWLNTGSGFVPSDAYQSPIAFMTSDYRNLGTRLIDVNGDGLPDIVYAGSGDNRVYLNTGGNCSTTQCAWDLRTGTKAYVGIPVELVDAGGQARGVSFEDVNGDGLVDILESDNVAHTYLNTGYGWVKNDRYNLNNANGTPMKLKFSGAFGGIYLEDLNGDGLVDWQLSRDYKGDIRGGAYLNNSNPNALKLSKIKEGSGKTIDISYSSLVSTTVHIQDNTNRGQGVHTTPPPMQVVRQVWMSNGVGGKTMMKYEYGGFIFHQTSGKYGFHWIKQYTDFVGDGKDEEVTQTRYETIDGETFGLPTRIESYVISLDHDFYTPKLTQEQEIAYGVKQAYGTGSYKPYFTYPSQTVTTVYDPQSEESAWHRSTVSITDIDNYGNPLQTVQTDVLRAGHGSEINRQVITTDTAYLPFDPVSWNIGLIDHQTVTYETPTSTDGSPVNTTVQTTHYSYNPTNAWQVDRVTTAAADGVTDGVTTSYTYDSFGNPLTVTLEDANRDGNRSDDRTTIYTYTTDGRFVKTMKNAVGYVTQYLSHDLFTGEPLVSKDVNQLVTSRVHDDFGRTLKVRQPDGVESAYAYLTCDNPLRTCLQKDAAYQVRTETSGVGVSFEEFDLFDRSVLTETPDFQGNDEGRNVLQVVGYNYKELLSWRSDPIFRKSALTNGLLDVSKLRWTQNLYDEFNRLVQVKDPDDNKTTWQYSMNQVTETDPLGSVRVTKYDFKQNPIEVREGASSASATLYTYDAQGRLIRTEDAAGNVTENQYDTYGNLIQTDNPDTGISYFQYNAAGELVKESKGWRYHQFLVGDSRMELKQDTAEIVTTGGNIWGPEDSHQYIYQSLSGDGEISVKVTSLQGGVASSRAGVQIRESLDADARNASVLLTNSKGYKFSVRSATHGTTANVNQGDNNIRAPYWVKLKRAGDTLTGYISPDGATWTTIGSTAIVGFGKQVYIGLAAASANNNYTITADFEHIRVSTDHETAYDKLGRKISRTAPEGTSTWDYRATGSSGIGSLESVYAPSAYSESYQYDKYGRVTEITTFNSGQFYGRLYTYDLYGRVTALQYPRSFKVKYAYTDSGQLKQVKDGNTGQMIWQADQANARGQLEQTTYGNGLVQKQAYEDNGMMSRISIGTQKVLEYDYDEANRMVSRNWVGQRAETFSYDSLNRLTIMGPSPDSPTSFNASFFSYDDIGNIASKSDVGTYHYDGDQPHAVTSITSLKNVAYTYDSRGNRLTGNDDQKVVYNSDNQLTEVKEGTSTITFAYAPDGEKYSRVENDGSATKRTSYVGGGLIEFRDSGGYDGEYICYISAGSAGVVAAYSTLTGELTYLHKDSIGSVFRVTDSSGNTIQETMYDPWGQAIASGGSAAAQGELYRGFTTHEHMDAVQLIHMNGRVYDPSIGRFLSADPFVQDMGNPQNLNRYSYMLNNPLSGYDPSGYLTSLEGSIITTGLVAASIFLPGSLPASMSSHAKRRTIAGIEFLTGFGITLLNGGSYQDAAIEGGVMAGSYLVFGGLGETLNRVMMNEGYILTDDEIYRIRDDVLQDVIATQGWRAIAEYSFHWQIVRNDIPSIFPLSPFYTKLLQGGIGLVLGTARGATVGAVNQWMLNNKFVEYTNGLNDPGAAALLFLENGVIGQLSKYADYDWAYRGYDPLPGFGPHGFFPGRDGFDVAIDAGAAAIQGVNAVYMFGMYYH